MTDPCGVAAVVSAFSVNGEFRGAERYGSGHIHDTYCVHFEGSGRDTRIILQRMNTAIFKNPVAVMENIERVTRHLRSQIDGRLDADRSVLQLVRTREGAGWFVSAETNGTVDPPAGKLWLTVSPKAGSELRVLKGNELKLVFPQVGAEPSRFEGLEFEHFFLQPMDSPERARNVEQALEYCLAHPRWRLSLQTHKILNIR